MSWPGGKVEWIDLKGMTVTSGILGRHYPESSSLWPVWPSEAILTFLGSPCIQFSGPSDVLLMIYRYQLRGLCCTMIGTVMESQVAGTSAMHLVMVLDVCQSSCHVMSVYCDESWWVMMIGIVMKALISMKANVPKYNERYRTVVFQWDPQKVHQQDRRYLCQAYYIDTRLLHLMPGSPVDDQIQAQAHFDNNQ